MKSSSLGPVRVPKCALSFM